MAESTRRGGSGRWSSVGEKTCSTGGRGFNHIGPVFDMSLLRPSESPAAPRRERRSHWLDTHHH
ncbi:hypothetical protein QBC45DRAFT_415364 [Copromyces sp. CBS 386.78]|nr:hypothetical protein QBC45DRAFT_415364 [Copromyces sp. CBS 386.78]